MLETPEKIRELQRKLYQKSKQEGERHWKKMIGKPCAGKLHARFDEGELEIGSNLLTPALYSTYIPIFVTLATALFSCIVNPIETS